MFRTIPVVCLLWLAIHSSCTNTTPPPATSKSIDIPQILPDKAMEFSNFLNEMAMLKLPYPNAYELKEIKNYAEYLGAGHYDKVKAGRFAALNGYTPVIFSCDVNEHEKVTYLVVYTEDGAERARLQIAADKQKRGTATQDQQLNDSTEFTSQWFYMSEDSLIEVRDRHSFYVNGTQKVNTALHFYHITRKGLIKEVPRIKESFDTYAARFPKHELPATLDTVIINGLNPVSRLTSFYDFVDERQDPLYALGKLNLKGRATILLYARDTIYLDDGFNYPEVKLVTYHEGKEKDRIVIYGGRVGENYETVYKKCNLDTDGSINLREEDNRYADSLYKFNTVYNMQYEILPGGKIVGRQATSIVHTSRLYNEKDCIKYFKVGHSNHHYKTLFHIRAKKGILVGLHAYNKGAENFMEFITANADNKIIDRYTVYNHLKKQKYADVKAKEMKNVEDDYNDRRGKLTCDAIIRLPGRDLHITPEGKFVK